MSNRSDALYEIWFRNRLEQVLGFSRRELSIAANRPNYRRFRNERGRACEQPLRLTEKVGDLRNLCDHNKHRDPTKEEIEELNDPRQSRGLIN